MNKIEGLLKKQKECLSNNSPIFEDIETQKEKLKKIKNQMWEKMFKDIDTLDIYTNRFGYLDTGIPCYDDMGIDYLTICFCYDEKDKNFLQVHGVKHNLIDNKMIPKFNNSTFFGYIDRKQPYINFDSNCSIGDKVEKVLKNWSSSFENIQKNLEILLEYDIEKKINEAKKTKKMLEQEILDYSKEL